LFAVPAVYSIVARKTRSPQYVGRMLDRLMGTTRVEPERESAAKRLDG
jgi:hypothetical protein